MQKVKVLVAASAMDYDKTSEGIYSFKFVQALKNAGYDVICLTSDCTYNLPYDKLSIFIKKIHLTQSQGLIWKCVLRFEEQLYRCSPYLVRKVRTAWRFASGYDSTWWNAVNNWYHAIRQEVEKNRPDIIIVRGAGGNFQPHAAMLKWKPPIPWVAHYHDPYPSNLYPEPYRYIIPFVSLWQERIHRRIIASADALTFPSQRLLEWVLSGNLEQYRSKAFVIPHIASPLSNISCQGETLDIKLPKDKFILAHTGTLLRPRDPGPLLEAFRIFLEKSEERRQKALLLFIGNVHPVHIERYKNLWNIPQVVIIPKRVSYIDVLQLYHVVTALILIEAQALESPFFPGKLADYLWQRKPILALSPKNSTTVDLLGKNYPLLVEPHDIQSIINALDKLWDKWTKGHIDDLLPPKEVVNELTENAVIQKINELICWVLKKDYQKKSKTLL